MPELFHRYAGHDTNRDFFMLNLAETRIRTRLLYKEWFPTLLHDVHQMGPRGARIFVPPFHDPIDPNIDPRISLSASLLGAGRSTALAAKGKRGVLSAAIYDNWWNGGNLTTPQRHNIVSVLTETASVNLASPIFLHKGDLTAGAKGFPNHRPAANFVDPWPGGWWRLRDIVDYQLICYWIWLTRSVARCLLGAWPRSIVRWRSMSCHATRPHRTRPGWWRGTQALTPWPAAGCWGRKRFRARSLFWSLLMARDELSSSVSRPRIEVRLTARSASSSTHSWVSQVVREPAPEPGKRSHKEDEQPEKPGLSVWT
jgi:hypothetical protein